VKRTVSTASALAVSLALALAGTVAAAPRTSVATALPNLPGGTTSAANDVNDAGQIVGWATTATATHAVLWQDGVPVDLGGLPGDTASYATAISNNGLIVGVSGANPREPSETGHAVLWRDGQITDLGLLPGGRQSAAADVNDAGQVVGCGRMEERGGLSYVFRGFLWDDGVRTVLPPLQPESDLLSTLSCATSINDRGQIAGYSAVYNVQTTDESWRAVTWHDGVPLDMGTAPGDSHSSAIAISQNGKIVGASGTFFPGEPVQFAAIWAGQDARSLARPDGAVWTGAIDINTRGVVVGQYAAGGETYGCRWIGGTVSTLPPLPGDGYSAALGINDRGLIVGWSADASGGIRAVTWQ
jgi:probable HAF family extracellular repeat protein